MKIILDCVIFELQRVGGISVWWNEITSRLVALNGAKTYGKKSSNIFSERYERSFLAENYTKIIPRRYLPFRIRKQERNNKKFIFHSSYLRYSNSINALNIVTIHDFTYEKFACGPRKWLHSFQKRLAVIKSKGVICVSQNTMDDLLKFYPWAANKLLRVVHNGVSDKFHKVDYSADKIRDVLGYQLENQYLMYVGERTGYKNFSVFIELGKMFPDLDLVIVGGGAFKRSEERSMSQLGARVVHFNNVSTEDLNLLYNYAFCLVYPSSYEGFGLPIIEAMSAGCPVVSTKCGSIPEIAGDAALLVDKIDANQFKSMINKLYSHDFRKKLIELGLNNSKNYSWDKCYRETYRFYCDLYRSVLKID